MRIQGSGDPAPRKGIDMYSTYIPKALGPTRSEYITEETVQELLPLTQYTMIDETEIACLLYNAIVKMELESKCGSFPFEFILGELFHLGKIWGYREARAKYRRQKVS